MKTLRRAFIAASAAVTLAGVAPAQEMRFSFGLPESYSIYESMVRLAERLSEAGLPTKLFASGSLLTHAEATPGLRDGLADIAFVVLPYNPAEFAESNLIANLSMLATMGEPLEVPGAAMNGASMEYVMLNCPECLEELKATNHVYLGGSSSGPYILGCTAPIGSLEEFQGKRIRVGAANYTRWVEYLGGVPVQMPGNETYDALSKNVLDCTTIGFADYLGQQFMDVSNTVIVGTPGGVFAALGLMNFNRGVWQGLSEEQRLEVLRIAARGSAETVLRYHEYDQIAHETVAASERHEIVDAAEDIVAKTTEFVDADLAAVEKEMTENYGVENAGQKLEEARALIEKWQGLTREIGPDDADALEQLYWDEIYSKLDAATYGMD